MIKWALLALAVLANVFANVALKKAALVGLPTLSAGALLHLAASPWLWAGGAACVVLLTSYVLALRQVELGLAYAIVTSGALVIITVASALVFGAHLSPRRIIGVALICSGMLLVVLAEP